MRVATLIALAVVGNALADEPQTPTHTAVMLVLGWDIRTHAITYVKAVLFEDTYDCELSRPSMTPDFNDIVMYTSLCTSPSDVGT